MTIIDRFVGDFAFLSNFHPSTIYFEGVKYPTVEHAYAALKTLDPDAQRLVREAKTPAIAKKLGRSVAIRPDWEEYKFVLMRQLIRKKFENPLLRPMLLATEDAELVEVNYWNDCVWGVCRGVGENHLGKILMDTRQEINDEISGELKENE